MDVVRASIGGFARLMVTAETFAWKGNQDMPGRPTLWFGGID